MSLAIFVTKWRKYYRILIKVRKLLKFIIAGSGAVVAGKTLPESWAKPIVDSVTLPAHAVTSGYSITVAVKNDRATDQCRKGGETVNITGTVVASNGSDLAGVKLNIQYTDNPPLEVFKDIVVTVQSGNTYSYSGLVVASVGVWDNPP